MGGLRLGDPGRRLWRQAELELLQEELVILLRLGVAGEDERAAVRGGEVNVQHLDGGELLKQGAHAGAASASPGGNRQGITCYRLIDPGSEWRLHRQWWHRSVGDLLGEDAALAESHKLYRCLDKLVGDTDL
jgi:hypothetical protein